MAISSVEDFSSGWMNWNFASGEIERKVEESSSPLRLLENIIFHPFMMDSRKLDPMEGILTNVTIVSSLITTMKLSLSCWTIWKPRAPSKVKMLDNYCPCQS